MKLLITLALFFSSNILLAQATNDDLLEEQKKTTGQIKKVKNNTASIDAVARSIENKASSIDSKLDQLAVINGNQLNTTVHLGSIVGEQIRIRDGIESFGDVTCETRSYENGGYGFSKTECKNKLGVLTNQGIRPAVFWMTTTDGYPIETIERHYSGGNLYAEKKFYVKEGKPRGECQFNSVAIDYIGYAIYIGESSQKVHVRADKSVSVEHKYAEAYLNCTPYNTAF